jgi:hypothetical protein
MASPPMAGADPSIARRIYINRAQVPEPLRSRVSSPPPPRWNRLPIEKALETPWYDPEYMKEIVAKIGAPGRGRRCHSDVLAESDSSKVSASITKKIAGDDSVG